MSLETGELIWLVGENIPLVTEIVPLGETKWFGAKLLDLVKELQIGSIDELFDCDWNSIGEPGSAVF